jgi:hypothetical protein
VRSIVFALLVACGGAAEPSQPPAPLPTAPSAPASASASVPKREDGPVGQIQDAIPHWLDLLARGEDERFIDEAVVPEELGEVLGSRTKPELVDMFKRDKHADVVKVLKYVQKTKPDDVRQDGGRTYVKYEGHDGVRHITFILDGVHVWIHN